MSMVYHMDDAHTMPYANYEMPSYMDSLDLSDISDYEEYIVTSSNEDIQEWKKFHTDTRSGLIEHYLLS